jgi:hypothetical protein
MTERNLEDLELVPEFVAQELAYFGFASELIERACKQDCAVTIEGHCFTTVRTDKHSNSFKLYHENDCLGSFLYLSDHRLNELIIELFSEFVPAIKVYSAEDWSQILFEKADESFVKKTLDWWKKDPVKLPILHFKRVVFITIGG